MHSMDHQQFIVYYGEVVAKEKIANFRLFALQNRKF